MWSRSAATASPRRSTSNSYASAAPAIGLRGIPREPIADHRAPFHLAARAELAPQPLVRGVEVGVRSVADATHLQVAPVERRETAVARREIRGELGEVHGGRS